MLSVDMVSSVEFAKPDVISRLVVTRLGMTCCELEARARFTVPVNPFEGIAVIIELPVDPAWMVRNVGVADNVKFCASALA